MQDTKIRLHYLYERWLAKTATEQERQEFLHFLQGIDIDTELSPLMKESWVKVNEEEGLFTTDQKNQLINKILRGHVVTPAHRVHFLRRGWFRYAAAAVVLVSAAITAIVVSSDQQASSETTSQTLNSTEIAPGGDRAILTLADGRNIALDNASNGQLAQQGSSQVVKLANGKIVYKPKPNGLPVKELMWNTMSTPIGGQYQVTLPDGTRVWLNAASSITFPTAFVSSKRQVKINGEVYFEVAKNKQKPFIVDIDGKSLVEVLGTSFNINSYKDEETIKTTLLEGTVKVTANDKSVILNPGQQATIAVAASDRQSKDAAGILVNFNIDLAQAVAWKNGIFNFHGMNVREVMRQMERWYDINVKYEGNVPPIIFKGEMYRTSNLSQVLDIFKKLGLAFRMEGKTLIITG